MKKEIIKGFKEIVKGSGGIFSTKNRNSEDMVENITNSVIDTVADALGGSAQRKGQAGGGGQSGGGARRVGCGCGGGCGSRNREMK